MMAKKQAEATAPVQEFSVSVTDRTVVINGTLELEDPLYIKAFRQEENKGVDPKKFFLDALRLGVYGKMEARIASFLRLAEGELDSGLEYLKYLFERQDQIDRSAAKGQVAEREIEDVLKELIQRREWGDVTTNTGTTVGELPDCKIGDITSDIGGSSRRLVIEAKMNEKTTLGDASEMNMSKGKNWEKNAQDTAYGQLTSALANRKANFAIIVFDRDSCSSPIKKLEPITILPEIPGMIVKIGRKTNDFVALELAYGISRDLARAYERGIDENRLILVVKRMVRDANNFNKFSDHLGKVEDNANQSIKVVESLRMLIKEAQESMARTTDFLKLILNGSSPSETDVAEFFIEAQRSVGSG